MTNQMFVIRFSVNGEKQVTELSGIDAEFVEKRLRNKYRKNCVIESITPKGPTLDKQLDAMFPAEGEKTPARRPGQKPVSAPRAKPVKSAKGTEGRQEKKTEKAPKVKKVVYPRRNLQDAPEWIVNLAPKTAWLPEEGKFSYVGLYDLIRHECPAWATTPVADLLAFVQTYCAEHPKSPEGEWYRSASANTRGDLHFKIQHMMGHCLAIVDKNIAAETAGSTDAAKSIDAEQSVDTCAQV